MDNNIELSEGVFWNNSLQLQEQSGEAISVVNAIVTQEPDSTIRDVAGRPIRYIYSKEKIKVTIELIYRYPANNPQSWLTDVQTILIEKL